MASVLVMRKEPQPYQQSVERSRLTPCHSSIRASTWTLYLYMQERELERRTLAVANDKLLTPLPPNASVEEALCIQQLTEDIIKARHGDLLRDAEKLVNLNLSEHIRSAMNRGNTWIRYRRSNAKRTSCDLRRVPLRACTTCSHPSVRTPVPDACEVFLAYAESRSGAPKARHGGTVPAGDTPLFCSCWHPTALRFPRHTESGKWPLPVPRGVL